MNLDRLHGFCLGLVLLQLQVPEKKRRAGLLTLKQPHSKGHTFRLQPLLTFRQSARGLWLKNYPNNLQMAMHMRWR